MKKMKCNLLKSVFLLAIIMALLLSGCASNEKVHVLKIGVVSDVGAAPFVIAEQQGFYEKKGLDIEIQVFKSAVDRDTALQTGNLDGVMADMLTVIFFNDAGFDVSMTSHTYGNYSLVTSPKLTSDGFLALTAPKIGLSSNTVIDFATQKVSENKGFDQNMSKVAIPQMPVRLEMLRAGELDGATLPEPLATAAQADGGSLIGSTQELGLYPAIFMMNQSVIDEDPKSISLMYEAYNEAVAYLNQTDEAVYYDFLVERLGYPTSIKNQFEMPEFSMIMPPDTLTFEKVSAWMQSANLTKSDYSFEDLTNIDNLPK